MKYPQLFADHFGVCIVELGEAPVDLDDLGLPDGLRRAIEAWQDAYEPLLPRGGPDPTGPELERIRELDGVGLSLADRLADAVGDGTKVRYVSSGTDRYYLPERTGTGDGA
jgi:hypothetical protein